MKNKEHFIDQETNLYEEILTYESLDQYEGLLNHYKKTKKDPSRKNDLLVSHFYLLMTWMDLDKKYLS